MFLHLGKVSIQYLDIPDGAACQFAKEMSADMDDGRWRVEYDDAQSIGRRYRRFDEVGAPLCITVDFESLDDAQVTLRDRDTLLQDRVAIADLPSALAERVG